MRRRISIRGRVRPSVRRSVGPSVGPSRVIFKGEKYAYQAHLVPCIRPCFLSLCLSICMGVCHYKSDFMSLYVCLCWCLSFFLSVRVYVFEFPDQISISLALFVHAFSKDSSSKFVREKDALSLKVTGKKEEKTSQTEGRKYALDSRFYDDDEFLLNHKAEGEPSKISPPLSISFIFFLFFFPFFFSCLCGGRNDVARWKQL